MATESDFKKKIQSLYKRGHLETALFSWINCAKYIFPSTSVESAINGFYKFYHITEEEYPMATARQTYYRMQKELTEIERTL